MDHLAILDKVLLRHNDAKKWDGVRFSKIKIISNTKVGTVGQNFVEELCKQLRFKIEFPQGKVRKRTPIGPWDIKIENQTFEVKTATEDIKELFQFNHIRYHRPYDALLCIGISLDRIFFAVWSKAEVTTGKAGNLVSMEKGANASYKLTKKKSDLMPIAKFDTEMKKFLS